MKQTIFAFSAQVLPACDAQLEQLLEQIGQDPAANPHVPFGRLGSLHFASFVIFRDEQYGSLLVFENNIDGPLEPYLDQLLEHAEDGLHAIYRNCEGYPAGTADRASLRAYLHQRVVWPRAAHVGNVGRTVGQIRRERALREALDVGLDALVRRGEAQAPDTIRHRLQQLVKSQPEVWRWIANVPPRQSRLEQVLPWLRIGATGVVALLLLPLLLPAAFVWVLLLRWRESRDEVWTGLPAPDHLRKLGATEDPTGYVQNHVASLAHVKPGPFRRATLRIVLWLVALSASVSTGGTLGGIRTIHFAHWSLIDGGQRLLFLSNFDGSWESYLDDFINLASTGLTAIWSNTVGFPRTHWRVFEGLWQMLRGRSGEGSRFLTGGAENGPRFKAIARRSMAVTNVWYSAYPTLTVHQIDENSAIREGLFSRLGRRVVRVWLGRF